MVIPLAVRALRRGLGRHSALGLSLLALVACADTGSQLRVQRLEASLGDLRSFQAEQTTQISAMQSELRALQGRVEELEYVQNQRLGSTLSSLQQDLSTLRRRVPPPAIVPVPALEADESLAGTLPGEVGQRLSEALLRVREGKFDEALLLLQDVNRLAVGTPTAAVATFWGAVSFEGLAQFPRAVAAYNDVISQFPRHPRASLALLRQASVLIRLGDTNAAKLTLQKLIADYPRSSEATQARQRLKDL